RVTQCGRPPRHSVLYTASAGRATGGDPAGGGAGGHGGSHGGSDGSRTEPRRGARDRDHRDRGAGGAPGGPAVLADPSGSWRRGSWRPAADRRRTAGRHADRGPGADGRASNAVSGTATLAVVLLAFFVAGIGAGVAVVIALSVRRTREQPGPDWPASEDEPDWPRNDDGPRWPVREDDDQDGDWTRAGE